MVFKTRPSFVNYMGSAVNLYFPLGDALVVTRKFACATMYYNGYKSCYLRSLEPTENSSSMSDPRTSIMRHSSLILYLFLLCN